MKTTKRTTLVRRHREALEEARAQALLAVDAANEAMQTAPRPAPRRLVAITSAASLALARVELAASRLAEAQALRTRKAV